MGKHDKKSSKSDQRDVKKNSKKKSLPCKDKDFTMDYKGEGRNDISWYSKDSALLSAAGSISTFVPYGIGIGTGSQWYNRFYVPTILEMTYFPAIAEADAVSNNAVNIATQRIYSNVRKANSGSRVYERSDLSVYLHAVVSAHIYLQEMKRIYEARYAISPRNFSLPKVLVNALGADFEDLEGVGAQMRFYINSYAARLNTLNLPNAFDYLNRQLFLNKYVFTDNPDIGKSQWYLFKPTHYYEYHPTTVETGGALEPVMSPFIGKVARGSYADLHTMMTFGDRLLAALLDDEDVGIISGDIAKAYGDNLVRTTYIEDDANLRVVFNTDILEQINNAQFYGMPIIGNKDATVPFASWVTQSEQNIRQQIILDGNIYFHLALSDIYKPSANVPGTFSGLTTRGWYLNFADANPNPARVMEATRFCAIAQPTTLDIRSYTNSEVDPSYHLPIEAVNHGSEVGCYMAMWVPQADNSTWDETLPRYVYSSMTISGHNNMLVADIGGTTTFTPLANIVSNFDWHPMMFYADEYLGDPTQDLNGCTEWPTFYPVTDVANLSWQGATVFENLNNLAMLGLYGLTGNIGF